MPPRSPAILRITCLDRPGLVAHVAQLLYEIGANIVHADQHLDSEEGVFFQRVEFTTRASETASERAAVCATIRDALESSGMRWILRFGDERPRVAILASKRDHCVLDLLARHRAGELRGDVALVISNHPTLEEEVTRRGYRFVHEPIEGGDKAAQESRIRARLRAEKIDLVVLARYMQILSPAFVREWPDQIINIHHSFLPAFAGANPYDQAYRRGVKLIGATSHYVTSELDAGPIITQVVTRVTHRDTVHDLERKGRELERQALALAVRGHLEDRIISLANKTVVFD